MAEVGVAGIGAVTVAVAWWSLRLTDRRTERARLAATGALGVWAIAAFAAVLLLQGIVASLLVPAGAVLVGFLLALARGVDDEPSGGGDDENPPWWPSFERELRRYERRRVTR